MQALRQSMSPTKCGGASISRRGADARGTRCIVLRRSGIRRSPAVRQVSCNSAWRPDEACEETTRGSEASRSLLLRTLSTAAAAALMAAGPAPAALADIQYVTPDQVTNQAKPLVLKQEVNKTLVWQILLGGAVTLFGSTVLLENNEALFPAIYRANQAMKMYGKAEAAQQQAPAAMEVEAAEVQQMKELAAPVQEMEDPLTAAVLEGISQASEKSSQEAEEAGAKVESEAAAIAAASAAVGALETEGKADAEADEESKEEKDPETAEAAADASIKEPAASAEDSRKAEAETAHVSDAESMEKEDKEPESIVEAVGEESAKEAEEGAKVEASKTFPSELSANVDEGMPSTSASAPAASTKESVVDDVSLDALEAALAAKLKQEEMQQKQQEPPSLEALEAALEAKLKAEQDAESKPESKEQKAAQDA